MEGGRLGPYQIPRCEHEPSQHGSGVPARLDQVPGERVEKLAVHGHLDWFPDYVDAEAAGAIRSGDVDQIAMAIGVPGSVLQGTLDQVTQYCRGTPDPFGRDFATQPPLGSRLYAVRITGALFHTQGGLDVDSACRVLREDGSPIPGLYAGGGAACGVSGAKVKGYLSGNGLLTAVALGYVAGVAAATDAKP